MKTITATHALILGSVALVLVACDPNILNVDARIAAGRGSNGELILRLAPCPGERIRSIELLEVRGSRAGDRDDRSLWVVSSSAGISQAEVVIGAVPGDAGVVEKRPLKEPLRKTQSYYLLVRTTRGLGDVTFSPAELVPGAWLLGTGEVVDDKQLSRRADEYCRR